MHGTVNIKCTKVTLLVFQWLTVWSFSTQITTQMKSVLRHCVCNFRILKSLVPKKNIWKPVFYNTDAVHGLAGTSIKWEAIKLLHSHNVSFWMTHILSRVQWRRQWCVTENIRLVKQSMRQRETTMETEWYRSTNEKIHAYRNETSNSEEQTRPIYPE